MNVQDELKNRKMRTIGIDRLKERNIQLHEIVDTVNSKKGKFAKHLAVMNVLKRPGVQQALLVGIELDELAEKNELTEPLLSIVQSDEPLFGIDETIPIGALYEFGLDAVMEFGHRDKHKVGKVNELDTKKDSVNTFADDLVAMVAVAAEAQLEKGNKEKQPTDELLKPEEPKEAKLKDSTKDKSKAERAHSKIVKQAAMERLTERGITVDELTEIVHKMQSKYHDDLTKDRVKESVLGLLDKRETHHAILVGTELDRLAEEGKLSEPLLTMVKENKNFQPNKAIALGDIRNGSIANTSYGHTHRHRHEYPLLHGLATDESRINTFTTELATLICTNAAGKVAHNEKTRDENPAVQVGRWVKRTAKEAGTRVVGQVAKGKREVGSVISRRKSQTLSTSKFRGNEQQERVD